MNGSSKTYILAALVVVAVVGIGGSIIRPAEIVWILGFAGTITGNLFLMLRQEKVATKVDEAAIKVAEAAKAAVEVKKTLAVNTENHVSATAALAEKIDRQEGKLDTVQHTVNHERDEMKAELKAAMAVIGELKQVVAVATAVRASEDEKKP